MNKLLRIVIFGAFSGSVWSLAPGVLGDLFSDRADIPGTFIAGILAGVLTAAMLSLPITRFGRTGTLVLGVVSLPVGAFVFGLSLALVSRIAPALTSHVHPWSSAMSFAVLSVISVFAVVLFPLALVTTHLFRKVILH